MKFRKFVSVIIIIMLSISSLNGCSIKNKKGSSNVNSGDIAMGRYVEQDFEYPQGVKAENYLTLLKNPEGNLELYTHVFDSQKNVVEYLIYVQKDGIWSKENEKAINNKKFTNKVSEIENIFYGEDGKQYILGRDADYKSILFRLGDNGEYEEVRIPKFKEINKEWNMTYSARSIVVLKNGMIAVLYIQGGIDLYSPDGKKNVTKFDSGDVVKINAEDNTLYYMNQKGSELLSYNAETMKQETDRSIEMQTSDLSSIAIENGVTYICDTKGVHQNKKGSSLWETVIDGQLCSLSAPTLEVDNFVVGANSDYYVVFYDSDHKLHLMHYVYDKNTCALPTKELTIYSLNDSKTIRQAIVTFQKKKPDVFVNFRIANANGEKDKTADYIKALNTELLAKKGADILVLDGLPIDSYIEKGVLEDIGSIVKPMYDYEQINKNIAKNYINDNKVYAMPIRFSVPIIYGQKEAVKAAGSIEQLTKYIETHSDIPLLTPSSNRALLEWFLLTNYSDLVSEDNTIDTQKFKVFLENVNKIAQNINTSDKLEMNQMNFSSKGLQVGYWVASVVEVGKKSVLTNIEEISSFKDMALVLTALRDIQGEYATVNNMFKANTLVGLNKSGTQKKLAKEFIQLLYTDEIQSLDLCDGFPMNNQDLDKWKQKDDENYSMILASDNGYEINAVYPNKKERAELYRRLCRLDTPVVNDTAMMNLILDEAVNYLKGTVSAKQASENASNKAKTYMEE